MTEKPNKPTLGGFLILLVRVFIALAFLVAVTIGILAIPFLISLVCVAAFVVSGLIVFNWAYVWLGAVFFLLMFGYTLS